MIPYANYSNISITDFGNSSTWRLPSGKHRACARINSAPSFRSFSSIHVQQGRTASYRDDLCSLGYTLVYAARQSLPWMDSTKSEMEREKHIETLQLCAGLPPALAVLIAEACSLAFDATPDYSGLWNTFAASLEQENYNCLNSPHWCNNFLEIFSEDSSDSDSSMSS